MPLKSPFEGTTVPQAVHPAALPCSLSLLQSSFIAAVACAHRLANADVRRNRKCRSGYPSGYFDTRRFEK
jgi:hypothetical protein